MMLPSPQHQDTPQVQGWVAMDETFSDLGSPNQLPHADLWENQPVYFLFGFLQ